MSKFSKAQAAMDFLMIYGWAVLVVIIAMGVLSYFGLLSPQKFFPDVCVFEQGIGCVSHKVEPSKVTLVISNNKGRSITVNSITIGSCSSSFNQQMMASTDYTFEIGDSCNNGELKQRFKEEIVLKYTENDTTISKTAYGNINTKVE